MFSAVVLLAGPSWLFAVLSWDRTSSIGKVCERSFNGLVWIGLRDHLPSGNIAIGNGPFRIYRS